MEIPDSDLEEVFNTIVRWIRETPAGEIQTDHSVKLRLYGLYKHITEGPCQDHLLHSLSPETYAKYQAYAACRMLSRRNAMIEYIHLVAAQDTWFGKKCQNYLQEHNLQQQTKAPCIPANDTLLHTGPK